MPEQLSTWYFFAASARSTIDELTVWALSCHSLRDHFTTAMRDNVRIREFLANGYFSKATLAVEITKVRFGVKSTTNRLIILAILMNGQPV